ncbi:MAG: hypothetical protein NTX45_08870 [Proteobacteria bacterium]|nr:hypothetical protein [Pseudomonadota bacterium]
MDKAKKEGIIPDEGLPSQELADFSAIHGADTVGMAGGQCC